MAPLLSAVELDLRVGSSLACALVESRVALVEWRVALAESLIVALVESRIFWTAAFAASQLSIPPRSELRERDDLRLGGMGSGGLGSGIGALVESGSPSLMSSAF